MLDIFALIVILVICAAAIWLIVVIGNIPGNIARAENHPQAEAISYLAWIGLLTMGIGWFVALVWAKVKTGATPTELEQRVALLEENIREGGVQA